MARGWESKAVEEQQQAAARDASESLPRLSPEQAVRVRARQQLQLSREHVLQQLKVGQDPRRRAMLELALADLEARLAAMA